jgi:hypothetical protein
MTKVLIAAALLATSGLAALAQTSSQMNCSHYDAMNAAGQMAAVDSMRSSMSATDKMGSSSGGMSADHMSSNDMAKKVAASCKDHPTMMVQDAMKNAMSH